MDIIKDTEIDMSIEVLLELSLSNMKNNVQRDFGSEREQRSNRVSVVNYDMIPYVPEKTLLVKARMKGETGNYVPQIRFSNVQYANYQMYSQFVPIKSVDGTELFVRQFTAAQTQAKVKCNCLDFYWRFATWNKTKDSLEGDPPKPYVKKTDSPLQNPNRVAGSCKHILKLASFLRSEGILR